MSCELMAMRGFPGLALQSPVTVKLKLSSAKLCLSTTYQPYSESTRIRKRSESDSELEALGYLAVPFGLLETAAKAGAHWHSLAQSQAESTASGSLSDAQSESASVSAPGSTGESACDSEVLHIIVQRQVRKAFPGLSLR